MPVCYYLKSLKTDGILTSSRGREPAESESVRCYLAKTWYVANHESEAAVHGRLKLFDAFVIEMT